MRRYSLTALIIVVVAIGILLVVWQSMRGGDNGELRVGVLFPFTGEAASYGEKGRDAIELARDEIRSDPDAPVVEVIFEDSKAAPAVGAIAMQKLVNVDHVSAVVGDIVSAVTLAVAPIAERNEVVLLSPTSSAPAITEAGEYIYRIWPSDLAEGTAIAAWATDNGYQSAAILHLQNDYGVSIAAIFAEVFEEGGGQVVAREAYLADAPDYRTILTKIAQRSPDVVYIAGYYADSAAVLRQARELGVNAQYLGTTAIEDEQFLKLAGVAAEGLVYPLATGFDASSSDPAVRRFVQDFQERFGREPGWVEAHSYDAFKLIVHAARRSDKLDGSSIKQAIDSMSVYVGVSGPIQFDENGDVVKSIRFKTVRNGRFEPLGG